MQHYETKMFFTHALQNVHIQYWTKSKKKKENKIQKKQAALEVWEH